MVSKTDGTGNLKKWERKTGRRHCPVVERVGGFNKFDQ